MKLFVFMTYNMFRTVCKYAFLKCIYVSIKIKHNYLGYDSFHSFTVYLYQYLQVYNWQVVDGTEDTELY